MVNNPLKYNDPTGHEYIEGDSGYSWWVPDGPPEGGGNQNGETGEGGNNGGGPSLPLDIGEGSLYGLPAAWAILSHWPNIVLGDDLIYNSGIKGTETGSRYIQIHADSGGWHENSDIGLLAELGYRVDLPVVGPYLEKAAKETPVLALAANAADIATSEYSDYMEAGHLSFGPSTQEAVGRVAGGWGGAFAGAALGAAVGSVVPVVGTAAGAFIGGMLGGFGGSVFGERAVGLIQRR